MVWQDDAAVMAPQGLLTSHEDGDAPLPPLEITITTAGQSAVCSLRGDVDLATAPRLDHDLRALVAGGVRHIGLDLTGVSFLGAAGITVLVATLRALGDDGSLRVWGCPPCAARLLDLAGLGELVELSP